MRTTQGGLVQKCNSPQVVCLFEPEDFGDNILPGKFPPQGTSVKRDSPIRPKLKPLVFSDLPETREVLSQMFAHIKDFESEEEK